MTRMSIVRLVTRALTREGIEWTYVDHCTECGALAGRTARRGTAGNAADTAGSIALGSRSGQPDPLACGLSRNETH